MIRKIIVGELVVDGDFDGLSIVERLHSIGIFGLQKSQKFVYSIIAAGVGPIVLRLKGGAVYLGRLNIPAKVNDVPRTIKFFFADAVTVVPISDGLSFIREIVVGEKALHLVGGETDGSRECAPLHTDGVNVKTVEIREETGLGNSQATGEDGFLYGVPAIREFHGTPGFQTRQKALQKGKHLRVVTAFQRFLQRYVLFVNEQNNRLLEVARQNERHFSQNRL